MALSVPAPGLDSPAALADTIAVIVGPERVKTDHASRTLFSQDIWSTGALAGLVVSPATPEDTASVIGAATHAGVPVIARGGGMSYTGGYVPDGAGALVLDMQGLDTITIDAANMTVTAGAGVTWAALHEALRPFGLRTPFWGPLSGIHATVGGSVSQNATFLGAGRHGPVGDSVTGLSVALADGSILRTGAGGTSFLRADGPDLTGAFIGDCGALGIKVDVTLRLLPRPAHEGFASFSFASRDACALALGAMQATTAASELFAFDPDLARQRMKRASLLSDVTTLGKVVGASGSLLSGLKEGARMALAGRGFMDGAGWTVHAATEATTSVGVETDLDALRAIAACHGGREIENTIPKALKAHPFTPLNAVLGPDGERWVPVHGIVRVSQAVEAWQAIDALLDANRSALDDHGITCGCLVTTILQQGFLIEPVFYWPHAREALHEATVEPAILKKLPQHAPNPSATALVADLRSSIIAIFKGLNAVHFQIGRSYPWLETRSPGVRAMMVALKRTLDPAGLINPGVLGL